MMIEVVRWRNQLLVRGFDMFVYGDLPEHLRKYGMLIRAKNYNMITNIGPDPLNPRVKLWKVN